MENRTPTTPKGNQEKQRKRRYPETIVSQDEKRCSTKKQKTREGSETTVDIGGMATTSGNTGLPDENELFLFCTSIDIPMVSPKDSNRKIEETVISKPHFEYKDLYDRLLSLETFQNIEGDQMYEEYDLKSANRSYTNCTSACQSQENIGSLSIQSSTCDLYRPFCGLSLISIKDSISEKTLSPVTKPQHNCSQCEIGYPSTSSVSEHAEGGKPPSSPIESVEPPYIQSDYLEWCIKQENEKKSEVIESNAYIPTDVQPSRPTSPEPFAFKDANDVPPQEQERLPENSNVASSTSTQYMRYFPVMWIDKTECRIENGDGSTALQYVTKVTANNNLPCEIFNPNPVVPIGAKFVGINNPEVLKRINYFNTTFGICKVMNPETGRTQVLVVGIHPNRENLVIGSIPDSCKLVVAKDVRGIRHVILQTTQD